MARILIVSRNPAMAMGLSATEYEVVDLRPPGFAAWITGDDDADALILDLENPKLAVAAVTNLRAHAKLAPVLLVSSDRPGWDDPELRQLPATEVLPLPISKPALLSALKDLIIEPWAHETVPPQHVEVTQALQELVLDPSDLLSEDDDLDALLASTRAAAREATLSPDLSIRTAPNTEQLMVGDASPPVDAPRAEEPTVEAAKMPTATHRAERDTVPAVAVAMSPPPAEPVQPEAPAEAVKVSPGNEPTVEPTVDPVAKRHREPLVGKRPTRAAAAAPARTAQEPVVPGPAAGAPPLSAVPRTRRSSRIPSGTTTSTSLRDIEALRPSTTAAPPATPVRRRGQRATPSTPTSVPTSDAAEPKAPAPERTARAPRIDRRMGRRDRRSGDGIDLVRRLSLVVQTLYGVPETAEVVVLDAVERTRADAGALLVPDEGAWRVAGGVGLRPLEHRYELHSDSWLVQQVAQAHKGVIVEESDIAREQLQGAPLASWRHLLAAPIPDVEAVLLLARREDPPFDEGDLTVLAALGAEAGALLSAAVDTRTLARTMWEFRDESDLPR